MEQLTLNNENSDEPFLKVSALEVEQPFGKFYVAILKAKHLLKLTFVDELSIDKDSIGEDFSPVGSQRQRKKTRLVEIAEFIETTEAAFPNAIILAANYDQEGELVSVGDENAERERWRVENVNDDCLQLIIPTNKKLANIIDGQHRLYGFELISDSSRLNMDLLCSIYLDLPSAYQGYIFATINFNQKSVNKSLAYQLYGLTGDEEIDRKPETWAPDRTAVFLSRRLTIDETSPFYKRIIVAAQNEELLYSNGSFNDVNWRISTATIVDGTLRLFSKKPKRDRHIMFKESRSERSREVLKDTDDDSPLRNLYLRTNDLAIYTIIKNYFIAVKSMFWDKANEYSYITKTVGIQALFDVLLALLNKHRKEGKMNVEVDFFIGFLYPASEIDFSQNFFRQASGIGRTQIKNAILYATGLISRDELPQDSVNEYLEYVRK